MATLTCVLSQGLEGFEIDDLDWIDGRKKVKAVTILIYETSV